MPVLPVLPELPEPVDPLPLDPLLLVPELPLAAEPEPPLVVLLLRLVVTAVPVSAICEPDCHPASRMPADAKAVAKAARILTSRTFRSGVAVRGRRPVRRPG